MPLTEELQPFSSEKPTLGQLLHDSETNRES